MKTFAVSEENVLEECSVWGQTTKWMSDQSCTQSTNQQKMRHLFMVYFFSIPVDWKSDAGFNQEIKRELEEKLKKGSWKRMCC